MALRRTPAFQRYVDRAKRHLLIDPQQALSDFNQALQLAPEKEKAGILKQRSKLLQTLGQVKDATRDKIAALQSEGAYSGVEGFAALTGIDKDVYVGGVKANEQRVLVKNQEAVGLGWCKKCKAAVELDMDMHCKLHPKSRITDIRLAVAEDVPAELVKMQEELTKRNRSNRVRQIIGIIVLIIIFVALCYFTNL